MMGEGSKSSKANASILRKFLDANPQVEFLDCQIMDYSSILRVRIITKRFALTLAETDSPISVVSPLLTALLGDGTILLEDLEIGADTMHPDWPSLMILPHQPSHAQVSCFARENGIWDGKGFRRCPRTRLLEFTNSAKAKHGMDFLIGVEIEFYIMELSKDKLPSEPVKTTMGIFSSASLRNQYTPVVEEIVTTLMKAGIMVRQYHNEGGSGFFEISTEPLPPLQAADALIYSQEAIKTICYQHGLHATMHPKPFEKREGVGSHVHLSISRTDKEEAFLAGLLAHWAPLAAFYMPNYDSYARVPELGFIWWSADNRSAAIRKIKAGHWELRAVDAIANPYLTLLAILTAGMLGFTNNQELSMKDPLKIMLPGLENKSKALDPKDVGEYGIKDKFARSLKDALALLKDDEELVEALGPEIVDRYLRVRSKEEENVAKLTRAERMEIFVRTF